MGFDPSERDPRGAAARNPWGTGGAHVRVDASQAIAALTEMEKIVTGEHADVMRYGAQLLHGEMERAYREKVDPDTGRAWAQRRGSYPWPLLQHTGTLRGAMDVGWGIKTKSGKPRLFGKAREGFYLGGYTRGKSEHKPIIVVANSVFYGRKTARKPGTGTRRRGVAPQTGVVPPRPFFGFGRTVQQKFAARYEQLIKRAAG